MAQFPPEVCDFGALFVDLQYDRTIADYVPYESFFKSEVEIMADTTEEIMFRFISVPVRRVARFRGSCTLRLEKELIMQFGDSCGDGW